MDIAPDVAGADEDWRAALDRAIGPAPADVDDVDDVVRVDDLVAAGRRRLRRRRAMLASTSLVSAAVVAALVGAVVGTGSRSADVAVARENLSAVASAAGTAESVLPSPRQPLPMGPMAAAGSLAKLDAQAVARDALTSSAADLSEVYDPDTGLVRVPTGYREVGRVAEPAGPRSIALMLQRTSDPGAYLYVMTVFAAKDGSEALPVAMSTSTVRGSGDRKPDLRVWADRRAPSLLAGLGRAGARLTEDGGVGQSQ